jgi:hypothetical protein
MRGRAVSCEDARMAVRRGASCAPFLLLLLFGCANGGPPRPTVDGSGEDAGASDAGPPSDGGGSGDDAGGGGDDSGPDPLDGGQPVDATTPVDAYVPPPDGGPVPGPGGYLDRCTADTDCASLRCADDFGPTRFCTRPCSTDAQCAHEHVCVDGGCVVDDTGQPCVTGTPDTCATGLCYGSAASGACTRYCTSAAECPSGYACTSAAGAPGTRICVDIERRCSAAADCATGLCIPTRGCTSECTTAADCPRRLDGLPPYQCRIDFGSTVPICAPPADILGDDPIGASCRFDGLGRNLCRSGACDESAPLGAMCTQACTAQGGCAPGLGCFPLEDSGSVLYVCERAGTRDLGATCATGRDCHSGLCQAPGYCTRLCADGLCPTGWTCMTAAGLGVSLCERP